MHTPEHVRSSSPKETTMHMTSQGPIATNAVEPH